MGSGGSNPSLSAIVCRKELSLITVLLVDDHQLIRTAIKNLLDGVDGIRVIGDANSGEEAVKVARAKAPNVVLMDIKMPGIGGLEAARKILRYNPDIKILGLSACKDDPLPARFVQAGASGFVTKDAGIEELVRAIREVHAGKRYLTPEIAQSIALHHLVEDASPLEILSERELQVMIMITSGQKVQEISDKLCLSPKTVNSYRYRLFEKLNVNSDVELTHLAIKHGLIDLNTLTDKQM